jgi:hypothetical protein
VPFQNRINFQEINRLSVFWHACPALHSGKGWGREDSEITIIQPEEVIFITCAGNIIDIEVTQLRRSMLNLEHEPAQMR